MKRDKTFTSLDVVRIALNNLDEEERIEVKRMLIDRH